MSKNPYPGLRPFRSEEASLFFGREEQTVQLLEKLSDTRFISVVGLSGCGKSSLVQAGLIPALESGLMPDTSSSWQVVSMRPGNHPIQNLAEALLKNTDLGLDPQFPSLRQAQDIAWEGQGVGKKGSDKHEDPESTPDPNAVELSSEDVNDARSELTPRPPLLQREGEQEPPSLSKRRGLGDEFLNSTVLTPDPSQDGNLAASPPLKEDVSKSATQALPFLSAALRRGPLSLVEFFRERPHLEQTNVLVLVDQFEELFRYHSQGGRDETEAFVNLLLASVNQDQIPIYVVTTMRSEFIGDCALFYDLPEIMNCGQFLTPRLTRTQQRDAISEPAKEFGGMIEPRLVNTLLNEMGTNPDQLPLLQHCLMRMWFEAKKELTPQPPLFTKERGPGGELEEFTITPQPPLFAKERGPGGELEEFTITPQPPLFTKERGPGGELEEFTIISDDYETVGGLKHALSNHADEAFEELDAKQQKIAEIMFRRLSERGAAQRDTRNPTPLNEIAAVAGVAVPEVSPVVEVFRHPERCFLTPAHSVQLEPDTVLDISHESLIRQWQRMNAWVEQEAKSAETYQRLEKTAYLWKEGNAGLWGTPDLEITLAWKEQETPTPEWAGRYSATSPPTPLLQGEGSNTPPSLAGKGAGGLGFKQAMKFLEASARAQKEKELEEERKRKQLEEALQRAEKSEQQRTSDLFESYLTHAALQARIEDYAAARDILKQSRELDSEIPAERRHARNLLAWFSHLMGGTPDKQYAGAGAKLLDVALSPDGKLLATVGEKGTVVLFETESGELLKRLEGHTHKARGVLFHPEGRWLATAGDDRRIILWSLPDGDILRQWEAPANIWALALSPDSALLASAGTDKNITLWKPETGAHVQTLKGHENNIDGLAFSPDGNLLASAAYDYTVRIWEVKTGKSLHTLQGYTGEVTGVTFHPDGKILAIASADKDVRLWELEPGKPLAVLQGHKNAVIGVTFVDAGKHLISASMDRTLRIWDTESGVALRVLQGHEAGVTDVTARGKTLFSAGNDGKARRWASGEKQAASFAVLDLPGEPASCAIVPDGSAVAVGLADGALRLYALHERKLLWENTEAHTNDINRIAFSPDGKQLASASFDNTVKLWQVSDGALEQTFSGHTDSVYGVAFSPEGGLIASASYDGRIGLFEIGKQEGDFFPAHEGQVYSVAFGASGLRLVSAGDDSRTRLWDLSARPPALLWEFFVSSEAVSWAAFSPDGSRIASVGRDYLVHILNSDDGSKVGRLVGHENTIRRVAFSPDGGQVATVSTDATVRLWDVTTATELFALRLPTNRGWPTPLWDFDFRCTGADCRIAVPLTRGKLVLYYLEGIYE